MDDPRYPIGRFRHDGEVTEAKRAGWIDEIRRLPGELRRAVQGLDDARLDTPYRAGGWTLRQVVHHLPDSHLNGYTRMKLALTEDGPTIRPYEEARWAELPDVRRTPVAVSLALLDALHRRWVTLLEALGEGDWARPLVHPVNGPQTVDTLLQLYAWHGRHHAAHLTTLREREGWR